MFQEHLGSLHPIRDDHPVRCGSRELGRPAWTELTVQGGQIDLWKRFHHTDQRRGWNHSICGSGRRGGFGSPGGSRLCRSRPRSRSSALSGRHPDHLLCRTRLPVCPWPVRPKSGYGAGRRPFTTSSLALSSFRRSKGERERAVTSHATAPSQATAGYPPLLGPQLAAASQVVSLYSWHRLPKLPAPLWFPTPPFGCLIYSPPDCSIAPYDACPSSSSSSYPSLPSRSFLVSSAWSLFSVPLFLFDLLLPLSLIPHVFLSLL